MKLFVFCALLVSVQAATNSWYVAPWGSDSNDGLSPQTPRLSIREMLRWWLFNHGDTLYLMDGVHTNGTWLQTIYENVTVKAYPGATPIITGEAYYGTFGQIGSPGWTIEGLWWKDLDASPTIMILGNRTTIRNCKFTNTTSTAILATQAYDLTIEGSYFDMNGNTDDSGSGNNLYIAGSHRVLIQDNYFYRGGHSNIDFIDYTGAYMAYTDHCLVRRNKFIIWWGNGANVIRGSAHVTIEDNYFTRAGVYAHIGKTAVGLSGPYCIVRRNIFDTNGEGSLNQNVDAVQLAAYHYYEQEMNSTWNRVYHNVMYNTSRGGVGFSPREGLMVDNNRIFNNIVYRNYANAQPNGYWGEGCNFTVTAEEYHQNETGKWPRYLGNNTIHNNIILHADAVGDYIGSVTFYYDMPAPWKKTLTQVQTEYSYGVWGNIEANPKFVDTYSFTLQSNSPAINAGDFMAYTVGSASNSVWVTVTDPYCFFDGYGITGVSGDTIRVGAATVTVVQVDHANKRLKVTPAVTYSDHAPVHLAYSGAAPDLGAYEYGTVTSPTSTPSVTPTPTPSKSPSQSPTSSPGSSPTRSPTRTPTPSPSPIPTWKTWYFAPWGNDTDTGLTPDHPKMSIYNLMYYGNPGQGAKMILRGGVYDSSTSPQISSQSWVNFTFSAYPGEKPIITCCSDGSVGQSGYTFEGITWANITGGYYVYSIWGARTTFRNCTFVNTTSPLSVMDTTDTLIEDCRFENTGRLSVSGQRVLIQNNVFMNTAGISVVQYGQDPQGRAATSVIIRNNKIQATLGSGVSISQKSNKVLVQGNVFTRVGVSDPTQAPVALSAPYNIIRRNIFNSNGESSSQQGVDAISITSWDYDWTLPATPVTNRIYNNVIYNTSRNAVYFSGANSQPIDTNRIFNNIMYRNYQNNQPSATWGDAKFTVTAEQVNQVAGSKWSKYLAGNTIHNNLILHADSTGDKPGALLFYYDQPSQWRKTLTDVQTNYAYGVWSNTEINPKFVDFVSFNLASDSPAIDAGIAAAFTTTAETNTAVITVTDAYPFCDGWGVTGVSGDYIRIGSTLAQIISIDYPNNKLTISTTVSYAANTPVHPWDYSGSAPDMGANEYSSDPSPSPTASVTPSKSPVAQLSPSVTPSASTSRTPAATVSRSPTVTPTTTPALVSSSPMVSPSRTPSVSASPGFNCQPPTPFDCGQYCGENIIDCAQGCPDATPFRCDDGECVANMDDCSTNDCTDYLCWDGSCAQNRIMCPRVPACPVGSARCNGGCTQTPCVTIIVCDSPVCADGTCPEVTGECPEYDGCNYGEFMCPDGRCVDNVAECKCSDSEFICFDGTCSSECAVVPYSIKPIEYSISIPTGQTNSLVIIAEDGSTIGSVDIWPSSDASIFFNSLSDSEIRDVLRPNKTLFTPVISLELSGISSTNFDKPVTICLMYTLPDSVDLNDCCLAYINQQGDFECASDVRIDSDMLCGETNHFTDFSVGNFKSTSSNDTKDDKSTPSWAYAVGIILGVAVIAAVVLIVVLLAKHKKATGSADHQMQNVEMENNNPYYES